MNGPRHLQGCIQHKHQTEKTDYKKYGKEHPKSSKGAPHRSSKGGQDGEDITT